MAKNWRCFGNLTFLLLCLSLTKIHGGQVPGYSCDRIDGCSCSLTDGTVIQLKYLGDYIKKYSSGGYMTVKKSPDTYYFNPCNTFSIVDCKDVLICQFHPEYFDIGSPGSDSPRFTVSSGDVTMTYYDKGGEYYSDRSSTVTCKCDESVKGMPKLESEGEVYGGEFGFVLSHKCCCPDACKTGMPSGGNAGGLSIGSILIIIFFVLLFVYLILGVLFMKYRRGAVGSEVIPNKSFWTEFPTLIKDGVMFVLQPCLKKKGYTEA